MMPVLKKILDNGLYRCNLLAGRLLRRQFPAYRISRGKIRPGHICTINPVDHCNLACRDCNHASPAMPRSFADPRTIHRDLTFLARYYKPGIIALQGGEPLLHPDLPDIIKAVRSSGICQYISLTTNGTLLESMPDSLWKAVNNIELSIYPGAGLDDARIERLERKARRHRTGLIPSWFGDFSFRIAFSLQGTTDDTLVRRIFRTCKIANVWGSHAVHEGHFYKCSPSIYIPGIPGCRAGFPSSRSGLALHREDGFFDRLWSFLDTGDPLPACRYCLGTAGRSRPQAQVPEGEWPMYYDYPTEDLIDLKILEAAEKGIDLDPKRTFWKKGPHEKDGN